MDSDKILIDRCIKQDSEAQSQLYRRFSSKMFGICLRYAGNKMEAEDLLQEGFIQLFANLKRYRYEGSLEGWIRRIFINTSINYYKKQLKFRKEESLTNNIQLASQREEAISKLAIQELLLLIQKLPPGYRTVFNLHVIEGYSHPEIAKLLKISVNTSKSQFFKARLTLQSSFKSQEAGSNDE